MNTPPNCLNATFKDDRNVQDLLKQLNDAKTELQLTKDELEQVNKDVNKCREEMDRRMMMMVQMDEGLWNSLLELDSVLQEKKRLTNRLQELTLSSTTESKQDLLSDLQTEESSLLDREHHLQLTRDRLRKAVENSASNTEDSRSENASKPDSSSQSKAVKPVRKRGGRK